MAQTFETNFLERAQAQALASQYDTPLHVYSREMLTEQATTMMAMPMPYGLTLRYAMKANPHPDVLKTFRQLGLKIDASSGYEAAYAIEQGFAPGDVLLTSQQLAHNLQDLVGQGVQFNATSLRQLEAFGKLFPGEDVGVRINPGIGSGHSNRTNVGGVASSFGIWHEYIPKVHELASKYHLSIRRMHTHIGSGTDPTVWEQVVQLSLDLVKQFPDVVTLNLGGGFKVGRMDGEKGFDITVVGPKVAAQIEQFATETGRKLHVEFEPGTFLVANAGVLISRIDDIVDTGAEGYRFLKLDTGMNDILRPSLYGAQHPIAVLNDLNDDQASQDYVVVGHNCESGDLLTPAAGDPETILPRRLARAEIGDLVLIGGAGAYCASLAAHGYNSFPDAKQVLV